MQCGWQSGTRTREEQSSLSLRGTVAPWHSLAKLDGTTVLIHQILIKLVHSIGPRVFPHCRQPEESERSCRNALLIPFGVQTCGHTLPPTCIQLVREISSAIHVNVKYLYS